MRGTQWGQGYNRPTGCSAEKVPHATFDLFYLLIRRLRGPHGWYGQFWSIENLLSVLKYEPWTTQPVTSHDTKYIILVPIHTHTHTYTSKCKMNLYKAASREQILLLYMHFLFKHILLPLSNQRSLHCHTGPWTHITGLLWYGVM